MKKEITSIVSSFLFICGQGSILLIVVWLWVLGLLVVSVEILLLLVRIAKRLILLLVLLLDYFWSLSASPCFCSVVYLIVEICDNNNVNVTPKVRASTGTLASAQNLFHIHTPIFRLILLYLIQTSVSSNSIHHFRAKD